MRLLLISAIIISIAACKSNKPETTESGLKYQFHSRNEEGKKPAMGDVLTLHMIYKSDKDSVLFSTYERGRPVETELTEPSFKGGLEEGFGMMSEGDSATFWISADSLFEKTFRSKLPEFIAKGSMISFNIKMEKFQSKEQMEADAKADAEKRRSSEKTDTEEYLKSNNITASPSSTGLYYIETLEGSGPKADTGKTVAVHYTGKFLDGKIFDSSVQSGRPLELKLGSRMVIEGWEEALLNMKKGGKATIIVPSSLGYGEQGARNPQTGTWIIHPYSPLVFDLELVDIK